MAYTIYGINTDIPRRIYCDREDDLLDVPDDIGVGSKLYVIATGDEYILNSEGDWVLVPSHTGGGSGGDSDSGDMGSLLEEEL